MKIENNIYLRKDGRYCFRYKNGLGLNGKTIYGYIYGKSREEVVKKKEKLNILIFDKSFFSGDMYNWLKGVKISCKRSTYSNYEYTVNAYLLPYFGNLKKKEINRVVINSFTEYLINKGLSNKTIKDILVILQQILRYVNINVLITMPKVKKKDVKILTKEDQRIFEMSLSRNITLKNFGLILCLYTGLRIGEICALKWESIDLTKKVIRVEKTLIRVRNQALENKKTIIILDDPKSLSSKREIPIPKFLISKLKYFKANGNCFFLTGTSSYIEPRSYTNYYRRFMISIGINKYNFHALRHTFATRCIESGFDPKSLSEILGHSNVKITLDRYVHPSFESKVKMMNSLAPMKF